MTRFVVAALIGAWLGSLPVARACAAVFLPDLPAELALVSVTAPDGSTSEASRWPEAGTWTEASASQTATLTFPDGTALHVGVR